MSVLLSMPIVLRLAVWETFELFEKGVKIFLSFALAVIVLEPFEKRVIDENTVDKNTTDNGAIKEDPIEVETVEENII